jgi:hypothetical protein
MNNNNKLKTMTESPSYDYRIVKKTILNYRKTGVIDTFKVQRKAKSGLFKWWQNVEEEVHYGYGSCDSPVIKYSLDEAKKSIDLLVIGDIVKVNAKKLMVENHSLDIVEYPGDHSYTFYTIVDPKLGSYIYEKLDYKIKSIVDASSRDIVKLTQLNANSLLGPFDLEFIMIAKLIPNDHSVNPGDIKIVISSNEGNHLVTLRVTTKADYENVFEIANISEYVNNKFITYKNSVMDKALEIRNKLNSTN